ncbi:uncharacterized protein LOC143449150 [Clavelina lepadiformis]|uniref:uncharacterized protein LOC143449150 n=1 Tax=Clavelina lepadiformis TaxID=159417 RepID=UPI00404356D5
MIRDIFKRSLWICFMVGGLLITESSALLCRFCEQATSLDQCVSGYECGPGIGCFSQTWVNDAGQRYYRKGCQQPSVVNCEVANDAFCTKDLALICCDTYLCNAPDPQLLWRPEPPRNFVASAINPTSITLQWDIQCNGIYAYEVTYDRNTPVSSTLEDINGQQVTISNLTTGSLYKFSIRSVFDSSYSDPVDIIRATPHDNSTQTICAESVNVTLNDVSSTTLRLCGPDEQKCFVGLHYWQNGGETYVSQGCVATELCDHIEANFRNDCIPGSVNSLCFICCEGNTCNKNNDLINSSMANTVSIFLI